MTQSGRPISIKQRWIFFLALLLMLYLAVQIVRAQEVSPPQNPTALPTNEPSPTLVATDDSLLAGEDVSGPSVTPVTLEPTTLPTDEPTLEGTAEAGVPTTPITPEPTPLPTDTLVATDEPTPAFIPANISITASMTQVSENTLLTLTVSAEGLSDVSHVAVACRVDPTVLQGMQIVMGDMLLPDVSTVTDSGFQPDGLWILIGNQNDAAPSLASSGILLTFTYQVVDTGVIEINCQAEIDDRNNQSLPLTNPNPSLTMDGYQAVNTEPSVTPTLVETEAPITSEAIQEITETPTDVPSTSTPGDRLHISGRVESALPLRQAIVTIIGTALDQVIVVQGNGTFSADMPAGEYHFIFTALYCLPVIVPVAIEDKPLRLPTVTLTGGDVDGNGMINSADATRVIQNFGLTGPLVSASADLNGDGVVNIYDLALVSGNISSSQ